MFDMPLWGGYLREWRKNAQAEGADPMSILLLLLLQCQEIATITEARLLQTDRMLKDTLEVLRKKGEYT